VTRLRALFCASIASLSLPLSAGSTGEEWLSRILELGADYLLITRSQFQHDSLVVNEAIPATNITIGHRYKTVVSTQGLGSGMGYESGLQLKAALKVSHRGELSARTAFLLQPWAHTKSVHQPGKLDFPFDNPNYTVDFYHADSAVGSYKSYYAEGSLAYLRYAGPRRVHRFFFAWLAGFRGIFLRETLSTEFTKTVSFAPQTGIYKIHTSNQLYGGELGFHLGYDFMRRWSWQILLKGGLYGNEAQSSGFLNDQGGTVVLRRFHSREWVAAGTITGDGFVSFRPFSYCELRVGYEGILIWGLAIAPRNIVYTSVPTQHLDAKGSEVISGLVAGLSFGF